jgi:peptide/nickel transport system ATP-binding protein
MAKELSLNTDQTPILEVEGLSVDIPVPEGDLHAVRRVSFSVHRGETFCLVGESGCGKSISALAVMDLLPHGAKRNVGTLDFGGKDLSGFGYRQMADIRGHRMSMIFQEPMTSLNPTYTVGNQLMEAIQRHRPVSKAEARERAVFLLEKVGITAADSRLGYYPHQLSGGLRQRVMIAMALMCDPELIIADEPTTALDVTIQAQILHLLADLQKEFNMGMILITHDLGVVARVAARVAVMYAGRIIETGSALEVFDSPLHPYTQGLLDCVPVPGKTQRGEHLGAIPGIVPTLIGPIKGCSFKNRCPYVMTECAENEPEIKTLSQGRGYECFLDESTCKKNAERGLL